MYLFYPIAISFFIITISKKKDSNILFLFFSIVLLVFGSIRYGSGVDYFNYNYSYYSISKNSNFILSISNLRMEPLFLFLMYIFNYFNLPFQLFIACITILTLLPILQVINKYSLNKFLSLGLLFLLYYTVYIESMIRQGLVLSFFLYSLFNHLLQDKKKTYYLVISILCGFHYSAFILFFIPIFINHNIQNIVLDKRNYLIFIFIALFLSTFLFTVISILVTSIFPWYSTYLTKSTSYLTILYKLLMCFIIFIIYNKNNCDRVTKSILSIYLIGLLIYISLSSINIVSRLTEYFSFIEIILLPNLLINLRKSKNKYIIIILVISLFLYFKDVQSFLEYGKYKQTYFWEYPYVTVFNYRDILKHRIVLNNRLDLLTNIGLN